MDEHENKTYVPPVLPSQPEMRRETPPGPDKEPDVASELRADAEKTLEQISGHGFRDIFNFDKLIFPSLARIVFVAFTVAMVLLGLLGVAAGFAAMPEVGFFGGLASVFAAVITTVFMVILARIWIEIVLVAFKINDGVQDIRKTLAEKYK